MISNQYDGEPEERRRTYQVVTPERFEPLGWLIQHQYGYWYIEKDQKLVEAYRDIHGMNVQQVYVRKEPTS